MTRHIATAARYAALGAFGLGCYVAGDMLRAISTGAYPWADHMPFVALACGCLAAAGLLKGAALIDHEEE